jgi:hypothetical protein
MAIDTGREKHALLVQLQGAHGDLPELVTMPRIGDACMTTRLTVTITRESGRIHIIRRLRGLGVMGRATTYMVGKMARRSHPTMLPRGSTHRRCRRRSSTPPASPRRTSLRCRRSSRWRTGNGGRCATATMKRSPPTLSQAVCNLHHAFSRSPIQLPRSPSPPSPISLSHRYEGQEFVTVTVYCLFSS